MKRNNHLIISSRLTSKELKSHPELTNIILNEKRISFNKLSTSFSSHSSLSHRKLNHNKQYITNHKHKLINTINDLQNVFTTYNKQTSRNLKHYHNVKQHNSLFKSGYDDIYEHNKKNSPDPLKELKEIYSKNNYSIPSLSLKKNSLFKRNFLLMSNEELGKKLLYYKHTNNTNNTNDNSYTNINDDKSYCYLKRINQSVINKKKGYVTKHKNISNYDDMNSSNNNSNSSNSNVIEHNLLLKRKIKLNKQIEQNKSDILTLERTLSQMFPTNNNVLRKRNSSTCLQSINSYKSVQPYKRQSRNCNRTIKCNNSAVIFREGFNEGDIDCFNNNDNAELLYNESKEPNSDNNSRYINKIKRFFQKRKITFDDKITPFKMIKQIAKMKNIMNVKDFHLEANKLKDDKSITNLNILKHNNKNNHHNDLIKIKKFNILDKQMQKCEYNLYNIITKSQL